MPRVILFELNEVPFRVLDDFARRHPGSHVAQFLPACRQYETFTEDRVLSPWVTWPTVHRGVWSGEHRVRAFGQDLSEIDRDHPTIWKLLTAHGVRCGVFGSLHTYPLPADAHRYDFFVPDTFAAASDTHPPDLRRFQDFNLTMARRSARNVSTAVPLRPAARFVRSIPALGLRAATVLSAGRQLVDERFHPSRRVRRRTLQAVLAFDVFYRLLDTMRPAFATFFTNHVASAMHRYWAAAYPDDYGTNAFDSAWRRTYRDEIDFTMSMCDGFLGRLRRHVGANPGTELWIATSMGQAATLAEPLETQLYLTDLGRFMSALDVAPGDWAERPAMAPEVCFVVRAAHVGKVRTALAGLRIAGHGVDWLEREGGFFMVALGHENLPPAVGSAEIDGRTLPFEALGLRNVAIEDHSNSNAYHVREGVLLVHEPGGSADMRRTRIPSTAIAPALLDRFGCPVPPTMHRHETAL